MAITEQVTIERRRLFNGTGRLSPFTWTYTVTIPGQPYPFNGTGVDWARKIAKKYAAGRSIVETWA